MQMTLMSATLELVLNIIDFAKLGFTVLDGAYRIWESGENMAEELVQLKSCADSVEASSRRLSTASSDSGHLSHNAERSAKLIPEVSSLIVDLTPEEGASPWRAFVCACKTVYRKPKIKGLLQRIEKLQVSVQSDLQASILDETTEIYNLVKISHQGNDLDHDPLNSELQKIMSGVSGPTISTHGFREAVLHLLALVKQREKQNAEKRLLENPSYQQMIKRQSAIPDLYSGTFEWVFSYSDLRVCFNQWLQSECGFYWIMGTAGSGKTTLMKYLYYHYITKQLLKTWSASSDLITGIHFFSQVGADAQSTKASLLQSLLTQILHQSPRLRPKIQTCRTDAIDGQIDLAFWTPSQLEKAFDVFRSPNETHMRFCFFIDGLDEQTKGVVDTLKFLMQISSAYVKICISGPPWNDFEHFLGGVSFHTLEMQALTQYDIEWYTWTKLYLENDAEIRSKYEENDDYQGYVDFEPRWRDLVREVSRRADGNFLWASGVSDSLLTGLLNNDTIDELRGRLRNMPKDVSDVYEKVLNSVDDNYRPVTAQILLVLSEPTVGTLPLLTVNAISDTTSDQHLTSQVEPSGLSEGEIAEMSKRLRARTKDLLLVTEILPFFELSKLGRDRRFQVEFRHNIVSEFVGKKDIKRQLREWAPDDFDFRTVLRRGLLSHMKRLPHVIIKHADDECVGSYIWVICEIIKRQREAEQLNKVSNVLLLDVLAQIAGEHITCEVLPHSPLAYLQLLTSLDPDDFLAFTIVQRLTLYVEHKIIGRSLKSSATCARPLLDYALRGLERCHGSFQMELMSEKELDDTYFQDAKLVELLLRAGANPNEPVHEYQSKTVWSRFLDQLMLFGSKSTSLETAFRQAQLMLEHGADSTLVVENRIPRHNRKKIGVLGILKSTFDQEQVNQLQRLMNKKFVPKKRRNWMKPQRGKDGGS